ncbi:Putative pertactin family virulence factor/autotransporter precursor [Yersinia enterocolitica]|nr:Putative pertactin family virulence factor/autotransporter precursor [Yersinia enterocolitica]
MNHRNTLNTRLLPLSILISSLVSGGAMAASTPTFTPGVTLGMGNGGVFIVGKVEVKEKNNFEKLQDYLTQDLITSEQHEKLKTNVEEKEQKLLDKSKAQAEFEDAQDKAGELKEAASRQDKVNTQLQEKLKLAETAKTQAEDKKKLKAQEKDAAIVAIKRDPADKDIEEQIAKAIPSANQDVEDKIAIQTEKEKRLVSLNKIKMRMNKNQRVD